jgi:hypothetical protein
MGNRAMDDEPLSCQFYHYDIEPALMNQPANFHNFAPQKNAYTFAKLVLEAIRFKNSGLLQ